MESRRHQVLVVNLLFFILSWTAVSLRIYVRTIMIKAFGKDDIAMLATLVLYTIYLSCQLGGIVHGTGQHRSALTDHNAEIALRFWFLCEIFYTLSTSVLKIAIGFFLLRITVGVYHIWIIRVVMIGSALVGTIFSLIILFQCKPVSFWWDLDPNHHGTCFSPSTIAGLSYAVSAMNALADWTFAILPIFVVKDLQMRRSTKIAVTAVIGIAALGSSATVIRIPYLHTLNSYKGDFLWKTSDVAIWTTVEVGIGIAAGCFATLRPLMKSVLALLGGQLTSSQTISPSLQHRNYSSRTASSTQGQLWTSFRPTHDTSIITTTFSGKGYPKSAGQHSEEELFVESNSIGLSVLEPNGISKSVEFAVTSEERISVEEDKDIRSSPPVIYEIS